MTGGIDLQGKIISGNRIRSLSQVEHNAACAAQGMDDMGIGTGDVVALLLRNDFTFFEATFSANSLGAIVVPLNWHASAQDINYILQDCEAKVLVAHSDLYQKIEGCLSPDIKLLLVETPEEIINSFKLGTSQVTAPPEVKLWDSWIKGYSPRQAPARPSGGSMIYTSGTTGHPKGVKRAPLNDEQMHHAITMACAMYGFDPERPITTIMTGPLYHSGPNGYGLLAARFGATIILQPRFDECELLKLIEEHKVTHLHMVPTMFVRLLKLPRETQQAYNISSLHYVAHGAAPCPPKVKLGMIDWWGPVINEYYGSTETGGITVQKSKDLLRKPGSVGQPINGVEIKIFDDNENTLETGEIGKIYIKSTAFGDFTYHKGKNSQKLTAHGKFSWIGDIGYLDADGFLFLCDRRNDIINSGGVNIYTAEIEATILEIDGVSDCAVFGIPDDEFGEVICAHVSVDMSKPATTSDIINFTKKKLGRLKTPKSVVIEKDFPRQESGKIFKKKLRDPYWQGKEQNI